MASLMIVEARTRKNMAQNILQAINEIGEDRIISIVMDDSGKIMRQNSLLNKAQAFIYYKD